MLWHVAPSGMAETVAAGGRGDPPLQTVACGSVTPDAHEPCHGIICGGRRLLP